MARHTQCQRLHLDARERRGRDGAHHGCGDGVGEADQTRAAVPWSRFSLINAFNQWKVSEAAGRRFLVTGDGVAEVEVTGLAWRGEVSAQVSEEAAVDLGRGPAAWIESRSGKRKGRPVRAVPVDTKVHRHAIPRIGRARGCVRGRTVA
jgi:putative transposase